VYPDITLEELKACMSLSIDISTISKLLKKTRFSYKKMLHASERDNEKNKSIRDAYTRNDPG
jgi:transposase